MYPKTNTWFADCWRKEHVLAIRKLGISKITYAIWYKVPRVFIKPFGIPQLFDGAVIIICSLIEGIQDKYSILNPLVTVYCL